MTCAEQTALWVKGKPVHNPTRDECCPDFSCCEPKLLWPKEKRERFAAADERTRVGMMMGALGKMVEKRCPDKAVYIAGSGEGN
jgi:hypothetical protein